MYKDPVTRPAGLLPHLSQYFKHLLSICISQNIAGMLLNQPIETKWNQEMSGNAEDSDGCRRVQVSLPHLRWSFYTGLALSDII